MEDLEEIIDNLRGQYHMPQGVLDTLEEKNILIKQYLEELNNTLSIKPNIGELEQKYDNNIKYTTDIKIPVTALLLALLGFTSTNRLNEMIPVYDGETVMLIWMIINLIVVIASILAAIILFLNTVIKKRFIKNNSTEIDQLKKLKTKINNMIKDFANIASIIPRESAHDSFKYIEANINILEPTRENLYSPEYEGIVKKYVK